MDSIPQLDRVISLRKELHKYPEVSNEEEKTAERITAYLEKTNPDEIVRDLGRYGVAAVYNGKADGPTVLIRCELDALPISEVNDMEYKSVNEGVGHKCGHDGHMAIIAALANMLNERRTNKGRVVLLFQPAEETGEGAARVIADNNFGKIEPDYVFALHNLPGYEMGEIILKKGIFASASKGLIVKLKGKNSHASHPKDGRNPALAASQMVQALFEIPQMHTGLHEAALITPVHIRVGSRAFGTSAGDGEVMATLRTHTNEVMDVIAARAVETVNKIGGVYGLDIETEWTEPFDAVENDTKCVDVVESVANELGLSTTYVEQPFPWSEDFGQFTSKYKGALFGLGSGKRQPQLHNNDYDFPDELIETGAKMFYNIIKKFSD